MRDDAAVIIAQHDDGTMPQIGTKTFSHEAKNEFPFTKAKTEAGITLILFNRVRDNADKPPFFVSFRRNRFIYGIGTLRHKSDAAV